MSKSTHTKGASNFTAYEQRRAAGRKIIESMPTQVDCIKAERERLAKKIRDFVREREQQEDKD